PTRAATSRSPCPTGDPRRRARCSTRERRRPRRHPATDGPPPTSRAAEPAGGPPGDRREAAGRADRPGLLGRGRAGHLQDAVEGHAAVLGPPRLEVAVRAAEEADVTLTDLERDRDHGSTAAPGTI